MNHVNLPSTQEVDNVAVSLAGVRVLDLTRLLPGGFCSLLLAEQGADVTKLEAPDGDPLRHYPPLVNGQSVLFDAISAGKRSAVLDLKAEAEREALLRLVAHSDVVLEGNRPGTLERLGLGWPVLSAANPRLILCSLTGYGQTGKLAGRAGHDLNYVALAGVLALNRPRGGAPHPLSVQVADLGGAQMAAFQIAGALYDVARGGSGRHLDVSLARTAHRWLDLTLAEQAAAPTDLPPQLAGRYACYDVYACRDGGFLSLAALEPKFWANLCRALGRTDLTGRQFHPDQAALRQELQATFAARGRDEWAQQLAGEDVCCEPVLELGEVVAANQWPAQPPRRPAPRLGEHTAEVLAEVRLGSGATGCVGGHGLG